MKKEYNEVDIVDYIKLIYKKRALILVIVIAGMLFTGVDSMRKPMLYEASATFFPITMNVNIRQEGFGVKPQADLRDLIIAILDSRNMAEKVAVDLDLKRLWGLKNDVDAQRTLRGAIKIFNEQKGLIRLSAQTNSAELSAKIANAYVDNLDYFNKELDIGAQRNIVQVIDRASVPQGRMPRNTVQKTLKAGAIYLFVGVCLVFLIDFIKRSNLRERMKEE